MAKRNDRKKSHARKKGKRSSSAGYKKRRKRIDRAVSCGIYLAEG
jgi:hypothetical protein